MTLWTSLLLVVEGMLFSLEWYTDHPAPIAQMHAWGPSPQVQMNLWEFNTNTWDFTDLQQLTTYPADSLILISLQVVSIGNSKNFKIRWLGNFLCLDMSVMGCYSSQNFLMTHPSLFLILVTWMTLHPGTSPELAELSWEQKKNLCCTQFQ